MPLKIKKGGAYQDAVGLFVKKAGTYQAVAGLFMKVGGVYQSLLGAQAPAFGPYPVGSDVVLGANTYKSTAGDNFDGPLSLITPTAPDGRYSTTRSYMSFTVGNGPRANNSGGLALKGYDVDIGHTGHNDANRGAIVSSFADAITQSGGSMVLKSRYASTPERNLFVNNTLPILSGMINTASYLVATAPCFFEVSMTLTKAQADMRGWHPTFWLMQMNAVGSFINTELDWEATSLKISPEKYSWVNGTSTPSAGSDLGYNSGQIYKYMIEIAADGSVFFRRDGTLIRSMPAGTVTDSTRPHYVLLTNHVADFANDPYQDADWAAQPTAGCTMTVDYLAIGTGTGTMFSPLVADLTYNVDFNAAFSYVLPTATDLWGSTPSENVEAWCMDSNEPGGNYNGGYRFLPPGEVTYTSGTRTLAGTITSNSGRLMIHRYAQNAGSACRPHRMVLNVGPHWTVNQLPPANVNVPYSYDLYAVADCGVLVTAANGTRAKAVSISGLPTGLSYDDATGLITGTATSAFSGNVNVNVTNSLGQQSAAALAFQVVVADSGVAAPALTGAPAIRNSWDFDKMSTLTLNAGRINSVAPTDGGSLTLANASGTTSPTRVTRPNSRNAALFDKAASQFLQGSAAQAAGGTVVIIYESRTINSSMIAFERGLSSASTTQNREELLMLTGSYVAARRCNATTSADASAAGSNTAVLHIAVMAFDPNSSAISLYMDGRATPAAASISQPAGMNTVTMGGRYAASAFSLPFDGYIYRVIDYPTLLNATQIEEVFVWAAQNYGTLNLA